MKEENSESTRYLVLETHASSRNFRNKTNIDQLWSEAIQIIGQFPDLQSLDFNSHFNTTTKKTL